MHVLIFIAGNILLMILIFFEQTIFSWVLKNINCFRNIQARFEQMDALSDDYFEVMSLKFLISEYERTKQDKQKYLLFMDSIKHTPDFVLKSQALNKHVKRLKHKESEIHK